MNTDALLKLAEVLLEPPPTHNDALIEFSLCHWAVFNCHTQACAVGTACLTPWFIERGLRLKFGTGLEATYPVPHFTCVSPVDGRVEYYTWDAVTHFFDITRRQAEHLFDTTAYRHNDNDARAVSQRIRRFVENHLSAAFND